MAVITHDLSRLPLRTREQIRSSLGDANRAKLAIALANQQRLAQMYQGASETGAVGRLGPLDMVVDPYLQAYFSRVCDARELVWDDPEFIAWLKKNEPATAVRHGRQRTTILRP